MSVLTRSGGGGWTSVSNAGYYGSVVSNYAAALQQAQEQQTNTEIENKVFAYRQGQLPFADLAAFMDTNLKKAIPGSQKELDMRQLIGALNEEENGKQRDIERSKLEQKYAKNGISASERVLIEETMLSFFKEGTPEFAEQQSNIALSKENERVDQNTRRIAELQARLASGGISTAESIDILEEQASLAEPGSVEQLNLKAEIETQMAKKEEEDKEAELQARVEQAMDVQSEMLDKFVGDGDPLTDEESLQINRAMQEFFEPGSAQYIQLKKEEAGLIQTIEEAKISAGKKGAGEAEKTAVEAYYQAKVPLDAAKEENDRAFQAGEITAAEYYSNLDSILTADNEALESLGSKSFSSAELRSDVKDAITNNAAFNAEGQKFLNGEGIFTEVYETDEKGKEIATTRFVDFNEFDSLAKEGKLGKDIEVYDADGKKSKVKVMTVQGPKNPATGKVEPIQVALATDEQGNTRPGDVIVSRDGKLVKSGLIFDQRMQNKILLENKPLEEAAPEIKAAKTSKYDDSPLGKLLAGIEDGTVQLPAGKIGKLKSQYAEGRKSVPEGYESFVGITKDENMQVQALEAKTGAFTSLATGVPGGEKAKQEIISKGISTGGKSSILSNLGSKTNDVFKSILGMGTNRPADKPGDVDKGFTEPFEALFGTDFKEGKNKIYFPGGEKASLPDLGVTEGLEKVGLGKVSSAIKTGTKAIETGSKWLSNLIGGK